MGLEDRDYMKNREHDPDWKSKIERWRHDWETDGGEYESYDDWYREATRSDNVVKEKKIGKEYPVYPLTPSIFERLKSEKHEPESIREVIDTLVMNLFNVNGIENYASKGNIIIDFSNAPSSYDIFEKRRFGKRKFITRKNNIDDAMGVTDRKIRGENLDDIEW